MGFVLIICYFIGTKIGAFFYNMFAHPVLFLLGLVRFVLVLGFLVIGVWVPLVMSGSGWVWVVFPMLVGLLLLFCQRKVGYFAEGL